MIKSLVNPWGVLCALCAVLLLGVSVVMAAPSPERLYQPPPPTNTPTPPVPPTWTPTPSTPSTPAPPSGDGGTGFLAIIEGYVWDDGDPSRPRGGVTVRYTSDGVSADVETKSNGFFRFVNVGPDDGVLDLADPNWQSGTGGVIIKPPLGQTVRVNLAALPKGKSLASRVALTTNLSSASASAGQTMTFTFKVVNGTEGAISGLMLGDQLPEGMTVAGVTTSRGDILASGPSVVAVDLNALAAFDSATVNIIALVNKDAKSAKSGNRATLLYREGAAIAAQSSVNVAGGPNTLPVTGVGVPIVMIVALAAVLLLARRLRTRTA